MMSVSPALSAVILAGGRSRRMGQDKALLTTPSGQPLLAQTAQIAQQLTAEVVVVTPWPERYRQVVPPTVRLLPEDQSRGDSPRGPLSGFAQGWTQIHADWCLLLACDLPYLESAILQRWWRWLLAQTEHWQRLAEPPAPLPVASLTPGIKGWEPLCGYYHRRCLPGLLRRLASGDRSFQSWLTTVPIAAYSAVPRSMLFNCNTPSDWQAVQQGDGSLN